MNKETVNLEIAGRNYPLKVSSDSERELLTKAVDFIEKKLKAYSDSYKIKDKQDLMAMCLLDIAKDMSNTSTRMESSEIEVLTNLDNSLTQYFSSLK